MAGVIMVEIKRVSPLHWRLVWRIIESSWLFHYRVHTPMGAMRPFAGLRFKRYLLAMFNRGRAECRNGGGVRFIAFAAFVDRMPVAAMTLRESPHEIEIDDLFVRPGETGRGIGDALLTYAFSSARKPLVLWTMRRNYRARRFYERKGGKICRFGLHSWYRDHHHNRHPTVKYRWERIIK